MAIGTALHCARSAIGRSPAWVIISVVAVLGAAACGSDTSGDGFAPVPTRTPTPTSSPPPQTDPGGAITVRDFTVLPTFECLDKTPSQAIVTVAWTAPSATGVTISLDGQTLPAGIKPVLPYQVPAGGATGIGATVAFPCDGPTMHTIAVTWSADGLGPATRSATITEERDNA